MSHDICTSGRNETHPIKNKRGMGTLFSCHGLHLRLQAIKLLASLTYPLKRTKGQSPNTLSCPVTYSSLTSDTVSGSAGSAGAGGA
jgi:hypothetical protein